MISLCTMGRFAYFANFFASIINVSNKVSNPSAGTDYVDEQIKLDPTHLQGPIM
jgi:hypothetical protein